MTPEEIIARLTILKDNYKAISDLINKKNDEITQLTAAAQSAYDEYFDLFRQLSPLDIPDGYEPTTINA